jgi:hypothetical protein
LHGHIISLRGEVWGHNTTLTQPYFNEVPEQARKVSGHAFVCYFVAILLMLCDVSNGSWNCSESAIFCFRFIIHIVMHLSHVELYNNIKSKKIASERTINLGSQSK